MVGNSINESDTCMLHSAVWVQQFTAHYTCRMAACRFDQSVEPSRLRLGIVVEKKKVFAMGLLCTLIAGPCKTEIVAV